MLELVDLTKKLSKEEYKAKLPVLQLRLLQLQQACWKGGIATVLVFEGWDGSGKGPAIRKLTERLEPRGFDLYYLTDVPRTYELDLPWMWRFWLTLPAYGKMAIFDRSWNRRILVERVEGGASELRWRRAIRDVNDFERMLADDGYVFLKFFLHISKDEQKARYKKFKKFKGLSWKTLENWQEPGQYDEYSAAVEDLMQHTDAAWSPWVILPAHDQRWVRIHLFERVVARLEEALEERGLEVPEPYTDGEDDDNNGDGDDGGES